MARSKFKLGKITIVLFLTVLIWAWADLALDETPPPRRARIVIGETSDRLWVSFGQASSLDVEVLLSGPHSAFNKLENELKKQPEHNRLEFTFNASTEQMDRPGNYRIALLDFLVKDKRLRRLGLKVKDCDPEIIDVNVVGLEQRPLDVECFDQEGRSLNAEINPSSVNIWAPESFRKARVVLSRSEIEAAKTAQIEKRPFIVLTSDQQRDASETVKIKLAANESPLSPGIITQARPGIVFSPAMQGKYEVRMDNSNMGKFLGQIQIRATAAAKVAYQAAPYHVLLEVDDSEIGTGPHPKTLKYMLPEEFVRTGQIELNQTPVDIEYEVVKLAGEN